MSSTPRRRLRSTTNDGATSVSQRKRRAVPKFSAPIERLYNSSGCMVIPICHEYLPILTMVY